MLRILCFGMYFQTKDGIQYRTEESNFYFYVFIAACSKFRNRINFHKLINNVQAHLSVYSMANSRIKQICYGNAMYTGYLRMSWL